MRKVFSVKGRVAYSDGAAAAGIWIALVDADPERDDLLGVGVSNGAGNFRLSFTREAFNQDPGEDEERPDLYAVFSVPHRGARVPLLRRDFPGLRFASEEDLGTIALPLAEGAAPTPAIGLRPSPGATKLVRRIALDDQIVSCAAKEVVGLVEHITGFSKLLDATRFVILDSFADVERRRVARLLGKTDLEPAEMEAAASRAAGCDVSMMALFSHDERVVYVNRPLLEAQNYDALRVVLGHELVHVGQSQAHPELDVETTRIQAEVLACRLAGTSPPADALAAMTRFMANIEGYASYVEHLLLRYFTHGTTIVGAKIEARMNLEARRRARPRTPAEVKAAREMSWREVLELHAATKSTQYEAGRAAYVAREAAAGPDAFVRFDPSLRPEPKFDGDTLAVVQMLAAAGDAVSQLELGMILSEGRGGVAIDVEAAQQWFRRAAEAGLAIAAHALGMSLPKGHPEKMKWLRGSAEQGYVHAQQALALGLIEEAKGPAQDAEAMGWLEKAAAQRNVGAMRTLATFYEKGIGAPRDVVKARVWTKRADAAERASPK